VSRTRKRDRTARTGRAEPRGPVPKLRPGHESCAWRNAQRPGPRWRRGQLPAVRWVASSRTTWFGPARSSCGPFRACNSYAESTRSRSRWTRVSVRPGSHSVVQGSAKLTWRALPWPSLTSVFSAAVRCERLPGFAAQLKPFQARRTLGQPALGTAPMPFRNRAAGSRDELPSRLVPLREAPSADRTGANGFAVPGPLAVWACWSGLQRSDDCSKKPFH
jgi:hypothetical protein